MSVQPMIDIETLFQPTHDERARQQFVSTLRKHAIVDLRNLLRHDYESRVEPALDARGESPQDWRGVGRAMEKEQSYRFYSSVRYNAQEMSFLSVQDSVERALPGMIEVAKDASTRNPAGGSLRIPAQFDVPRYVSAFDVHLVPGSFNAEYTADDVAQGAVIWFGSKVFAGRHPFRKMPGAVAESVAQWLRRKQPGFAPRRILDMATTSGKNLLPYRNHFPQAELFGIDVGAPGLRIAHAMAEAAGVPVHYGQQNAEQTDFPDGQFDLIVSSFFFHEIPLKSTQKVLRECLRLLAPGGLMVHMELPSEASVGPFENFFWNWDTAYNAEPYYTAYRAQDPVALCTEAGFPAEASFAHAIPDWSTFGEERFARYLRGELPAPPHGSGGWYVFGSRKPGAT